VIFEKVLRPRLFRVGGGDAESAHEWTLHRLAGLSAPVRAAMRALYRVDRPVRLFGVDFPNRVGLAAGMDKNGIALRAWPALGFGFAEIGTVTAHAQPGNDKPRVFRDVEKQAVINRMGFNNAGAAALARRLAAIIPPAPGQAGMTGGPGATARPHGDVGARSENIGRLAGEVRVRPADAGRVADRAGWPAGAGIPLGISLGKSKVTPLDEAVADYRASYDLLAPYADYIAVNVSSPNTPGLRELQDRSHLDAILTELKGDVPVLVKLAPDLTEQAIAEALEVCLDRGVAGVIATNTTIAHDGPQGGLSGAPLTERAQAVVSFIHRESSLPVIGVGGIMTPDDAARMFDAGAALIQLYTGFIYHGPALVRAAAKTAPGPGR
jgi:dihydroorotate dehydrogenase